MQKKEKKLLIRVDLTTIKRSNNLQHIPGMKRITFTGTALDFTGNMNKPKWTDFESPVVTSINIDQPVQEVIYPPGHQNYSYEYEDTFVTCESCKSSFNHKYLSTDGDWDWYAEDICPVCRKGGCCEYELEKLSDSQCAKFANKNKMKK